MKRLLLLLIISFFAFNANAQFVNYERDGGWNLGFNLGGAWQQAEPFENVKSKPYAGFSGGFTLGKAIYERPGAFLAFDLRFRYLRAKNYGWVGLPQYGSEYIDTSRNISFGFKNYKMDMNEFTLEGVLTLHSLREKTGILLYGFGGVGLVDYRVKTDQLTDDFGSQALYDFTSFGNEVDTTQSYTAIATQLKDFSDRDFESTIKGSEWGFMPSLGFGLGYQITPSFSMGVEHKITYALHDNLDGITNSGKNDNSHYTALVLRWNLLGGRESYKPNPDNNVNNWTTPNNTTTQVTQTAQEPKPLVNIYNPANNNSEVHSSTYTIKAKVYNVKNSSGITFKQNGLINSGFTFNPSNNEFSAQVYLQPGTNSFELLGTNTAGSDQDSRIIIYTIPQDFTTAPAPIVTFTNPSIISSSVTQAQYNIMATVLNVNGSKDNITFTVNGVNTNNFTYNANNTLLTASINLVPGNNTITIKGVNLVGSDVKSVNINYSVPQTINPPVVTFNTPVSSPYTTNSPVEIINATALNVSTKSDLKVVVNGVNLTNFTFDTFSKKINFSTNLIVGANVVQITGSNSAGIDSKSTTIIYKVSELMPPPIVDFTTPNMSPFNTTASNMTLKATVLNVTSKSYITVSINGITSSNFNYNSTTKEVEFNVNLVTGNNIFKIKATNATGSDEDNQIVVKEIANVQLPPIVNVTNPNSNPYSTSVSNQIFNAIITNVDNISGVNAKFNGVAITNFTFDPTSDKFVYSAQLVPGANILEITGSNAVGTASKSQTVIYTEPVVICDNPEILLTQPTVRNKAVNTVPGNTSLTINTTNSKGAIIATIKNATSIEYKIDGQSSPGYNYNAAKNYFESFLHLKEGANTYQLIATNDCGTTIQDITIIYSPQEIPCEKPIINLITPNSNPFNYTGPQNLSISASVIGVTENSQIVCKLNNTIVKKLYDPNTRTVSGNLVLAEGNNTLELTATNECGSTTVQSVIFYTKPLAPPTVNITLPTPMPHSTTNGNVAVKASVTNIDAASGIQIFLDGQSITNFNYNNSNKQVSFNLSLAIGSHTVTVKATNTAGTAQDSGEIVVIEEVSNNCDDPSITISQPRPPTKANTIGNATISVTTSNNTAVISGTMTNTSNVVFTANGQNSSNFTFNPSSGSFNSYVTLNVGVNTYHIMASNNCGTVTANQTIVIENIPEVAPCNQPTVVFVSPTGLNQTATIATQSVTLKVMNVASESSIFSQLNNAYINQNFDASTGTLSLNLNLVSGNNDLVVMAKNDCGSAEATMHINYIVTQNETHSSNSTTSDPTVNTNDSTNNSGFGTGNNIFNNGGSEEEEDSSPAGNGNGNNGHGNNTDGVDSSNPGQGNGGPNGQTDASGNTDDENNSSNGNGNPSNIGTGNSNGNNGNKSSDVDIQFQMEIEKANNFYNSKNYNAANEAYFNALQLKPNDVHAKQRLQEIDQIRKQEAAKLKAEQEAAAKDKAEKAAQLKAEQEAAAKAKAEQDAKLKAEQDADAKAKAEKDAQLKAQQDAQLKAQQDAAAKAKAEQDAKLKAQQDAAAKAKAEQDAQLKAQQDAAAKAKAEQDAKLKAQQDAAAAKEQAYNDEISKGDLYFKAGKYETAKTHYTKALSYQPSSAYAKGKLTEIDNKLKAQTTPVDKPTAPTPVVKPTIKPTKPVQNGGTNNTTTPATPTTTKEAEPKTNEVTKPVIKPVVGGRSGG